MPVFRNIGATYILLFHKMTFLGMHKAHHVYKIKNLSNHCGRPCQIKFCENQFAVEGRDVSMKKVELEGNRTQKKIQACKMFCLIWTSSISAF